MPANIDLKLDSFIAISPGGQFCTALMSLGAGSSGNVSMQGDVLVVKSSAVTLKFTVQPPAGSSATYHALGIAFRGPSTDPLGKASFDLTTLKLNGPTLSIHNSLPKQDGNSRKARYHFLILIQQESDGALGIIDPDIQNED